MENGDAARVSVEAKRHRSGAGRGDTGKWPGTAKTPPHGQREKKTEKTPAQAWNGHHPPRVTAASDFVPRASQSWAVA